MKSIDGSHLEKYNADNGAEKEFLMKTFIRIVVVGLALCAALLVTSLSALSLSDKDVQMPLKTIEVKHFTQAEGMKLSQEFINYFYDGLRAYLPKAKVAEQIIEEGGAVPEADAANSVVVEGKFTGYSAGGGFTVGKVVVEIKLYRRSDNKLITTITPEIPFKPSPLNKDKGVATATGGRAAYQIQKALK